MKKNNLQDLQKEYGDVHKRILNSTSHYNIIIKQKSCCDTTIHMIGVVPGDNSMGEIAEDEVQQLKR